MTRRHARPRAAALGLAFALATILAACPAPDDTPPPEPQPDPVAPADDDDPNDAIVLDRSCTNEGYGFQVDYPAGWVTNPGDVMPACTAFDPDAATIPPATHIPTDIAVVIRREDAPFPRTSDFDADPTVHVVSRRDASVNGRTAVVAELQHTGEGMYPQGHRHYAWHVDLGDRTLIATTHDVDAAGPPGYERRKRILDAMMGSLRFP